MKSEETSHDETGRVIDAQLRLAARFAGADPDVVVAQLGPKTSLQTVTALDGSTGRVPKVSVAGSDGSTRLVDPAEAIASLAPSAPPPTPAPKPPHLMSTEEYIAYRNANRPRRR
jgi:hypothetical protein